MMARPTGWPDSMYELAALKDADRCTIRFASLEDAKHACELARSAGKWARGGVTEDNGLFCEHAGYLKFELREGLVSQRNVPFASWVFHNVSTGKGGRCNKRKDRESRVWFRSLQKSSLERLHGTLSKLG